MTCHCWSGSHFRRAAKCAILVQEHETWTNRTYTCNACGDGLLVKDDEVDAIDHLALVIVLVSSASVDGEDDLSGCRTIMSYSKQTETC